MDIHRIREILPHRYPLLLVDRVVEVEAGRRLRAFKNVTANEPFFEGHFPGHPVMPGVLIIEAMAQAGALLAYESDALEFANSKVVYLLGLDRVRFRRPVVPGDRLDIDVEIIRHKGRIWKQRASATVEGQRAAECEVLASVMERGI